MRRPDGDVELTGAEVRVSVCMAAYQGSAHIQQQVASILTQLQPCDELVIVDDASTDATVDLIRECEDSRVRLVCNDTNTGYVRAFEQAMRMARGRFILLSDQDDVWLPGRVDEMLAGLRRRAVVATSVCVLGEPESPPRFRLRAEDSERYRRNIFAVMIGYRPYTGCAMGLRRSFLTSVLPIPRFLSESHDLWIALIANTHRENLHLEKPSVARRLHGANQTPLGWRSLRTIIRARWVRLRCLRIAVRRSREYRRTASATEGGSSG